MKAEVIPNFPEYFITKGGDVWSEKTNRCLKSYAKGNGYPYVIIYDADKRRHSGSIHSLVAETYLAAKAEGWVVNHMMGDTGFEPVTSSLSRKHSTTELIAQTRAVKRHSRSDSALNLLNGF